MGSVSKPQYDNEGALVLKGELFFRWKASHESIQRLDAEIKLRTHTIDAILETQPELKKLLGERATLVQQAITSRNEHKTVLGLLEDHLGFPMTNVSIDDVTGRVHRLDAGSDVPAPITNGVNKTPKAASKKSTKPKTTKKGK